MCGRFALAATPEELSHHFNLRKLVTLESRYNIAPTQPITIIRDSTGCYRLSAARWGLIPHWAKDEKIGNKLINARSETIAEKPSFRDAFKERRCLIPAIGFYEWLRKDDQKQPYFIKMKDSGLFAMAGIWESWKSSDGKVIESCAIITTTANGIVGKIHDRMPVIIPKESYGLWIDPARNGHPFREYLQPCSPFKMTAYPVSGMVNNPKNEGPGCMKKVAAE
ncbi:MAG: SOS response-associated peptidase [Desulfobulbaceae bacterium]|nr:SOS response-associated peptidase [Desulfobulbaceae bacterium]